MANDFPHLERPSRLPLVEQIVRHYRTAIQQGRLRAGDRLPTIRVVAERLKVTRNTVQDAYRKLAGTRMVSATVVRGTVVTGTPNGSGSPFSSGALATRRQQESAPQAPAVPPGTAVRANFAGLLPDQDEFPVDAFRASIERVLRSRGSDLLVYGNPAGSPELRRACGDAPGEADEILITNGAQQGIDLVLRAFTEPGDAVAVAVPTYHQLFGLLSAHGLEAVPVAIGSHGIDPGDLERVLARPGVRLLYLMPTFQNPTGRSLDALQRQQLMHVVTKTRVPVLEDEFQRELRFAGEPAPSLRALDARELTVTVRTFSKGLFPGVRIGWVQAPLEILATLAALKRATDLETSPLLQAALVDFMAQGALGRHLESLRARLRERHAVAQTALAAQMPDGTTWSRPEGGFALWLEGPPGLDGDRLAEHAARRGVLATPGRVFDPLARPSSGLRLSLSRTSLAQIAAGIEILGACARDLLARGDLIQRPNFL